MYGVIICVDDEKNSKNNTRLHYEQLTDTSSSEHFLFLANACFCLPFYCIEHGSEEHSSENRSVKLLERRYSIAFQS